MRADDRGTLKGDIAVEILAAGLDESLKEHVARRAAIARFDGFEVGDRARRIYAWPEARYASSPFRIAWAN